MREIQGCGNANGVQLYYHLFAGENVLPADMHANWPRKIDYKVNRQRQSLSDAGRQRSAFDSHFREWAIAKNQNGI